jgi:hypothetical protein
MSRHQSLKTMQSNNPERFEANIYSHYKVTRKAIELSPDYGFNEVFKHITDELNRRHKIKVKSI